MLSNRSRSTASPSLRSVCSSSTRFWMNCKISASSMALSLPPQPSRFEPETMTAMTSNAHETARSLVADMTEDEKLWCLDGDAPFWAGLGYMGRGGYHKSPFYAARVERLGLPGIRVQRRPAWRRRRSRHLLPGQHGSRRDLGPRPRGAHRRRDRPRAASHRRGPLRRRVRERAPPPGVGTGTGDLRRGSAPRRRDGRSADPRRAAPRDGLREALRVQLDGERALQGRHRGRRGRACTRSTSRTSSASSTRASPSS